MNEKTVRPLVITIDGPAGAGKSTVARIASEKLGLPYLDTGAIYRAVAWFLKDRSVAPGETNKIEAVLTGISISLSDGRVSVNGRDVTAEIRTPDVDASVSSYSALKPVRDALIGLQREQAANGLVADGRDMGTVVFPNADLKIFLQRMRKNGQNAVIGRGLPVAKKQTMGKYSSMSTKETSMT